MVLTRKRVWGELILVVLALTVGAVMLYALLPLITAPDQQVVPPPQEMDLTQTLLMLFVAATAIGAPLTAGIVLALVFKVVSPRVPASSSVAPEIPAPKAKPAQKTTEPKEMSPGEARLWKVLATLLVLAVGALGLVAAASAFLQTYGLK
jgi:hypothetical protein